MTMPTFQTSCEKALFPDFAR